MDPVALAALLQNGGPWALLSLSLLANKYLFERGNKLQEKVESILGEWRKDSLAQSDRLTTFLEKAVEEERKDR